MVATEIVTAIVLCVTGAVAVFMRKSKCFVREDAEGNVTWGIGFTDRPIVPKNSADSKDETSDGTATSSASECSGSDGPHLGHGEQDIQRRDGNLQRRQGRGAIYHPSSWRSGRHRRIR
jgi:hypothetical protein